jgi:hypothetical protein
MPKDLLLDRKEEMKIRNRENEKSPDTGRGFNFAPAVWWAYTGAYETITALHEGEAGGTGR